MSSLNLFRPRPAQYVENGQDSAVRVGKTFIFDANITALPPTNSAIVRFTTGVSAIVFTGGELSVDQESSEFEVFEDSTFSASGVLTSALIRNMNRIINTASEIITYDTPTVTDNGVLVAQQHVFGQAGKNVNVPGFGGNVQDANFILKPNTEHLFKVTNNSALDINIEAHYFFREVNAKQYS